MAMPSGSRAWSSNRVTPTYLRRVRTVCARSTHVQKEGSVCCAQMNTARGLCSFYRVPRTPAAAARATGGADEARHAGTMSLRRAGSGRLPPVQAAGAEQRAAPHVSFSQMMEMLGWFASCEGWVVVVTDGWVVGWGAAVGVWGGVV